MTLLLASDPATSLASVGDGTLSAPPLRLVRLGAKPQSWSLPAGRCTVGSSLQCQIQLTDEQIRPLHCLIVHNAKETLVTRWAANALLNGEEFSTSPFKHGDRLTIGGIELELIAEGAAVPANDPVAAQVEAAFSPSEDPPRPPVQAELDATPAPLVAPRRTESTESSDSARQSNVSPAQWERDRLVRRLWSANYNSRSRCRQIIGSLRTSRSESANLDLQLKSLRGQLHRTVDERERLAAELKQLQAQHDERDRQATAELDRLISELTAAYERANAAEQSVAGQLLIGEELRKEIAVLTRERQQIEQAQVEEEQNSILLSEELADRDRTIDHLVRQLHDVQDAEERTKEQAARLASEIESLEHQLAGQRAQREELTAERANQADRLLQFEHALADRDRTIAVLESQLAATALEEKSFQQQNSQHLARIASLETELGRLQGERDDLIVDQSKRMNHLCELEQSLLNRDLAISHLESQLQESAAVTQAVEQNLADYAARLDSLESARKSLAADQAKQLDQLQEMGDAISDRDQLIEQLKRELEDARHSANITAEQQSAEYAERIRSLTADRDALVFAQTRATEELQCHNETIAHRDAEIAEFRQYLEESRLALSQHEQQSAAQASRIQSLAAEREALLAERGHLSDQVQELGAAVGDRDRQVEQLQRLLDEAHEAARLAEEQAARYVATIEGLHAELQQKEAQREQLTALQAEFAQRRQQFEETVAERDRAIESLGTQLDTAEEATMRSQEREAAQAATVAELTQRQQQLEKRLVECDQAIESLQIELGDAEEACNRLKEREAEHGANAAGLQRELEAERAAHERLAATHAKSEDRFRELDQAIAERDRRHAELERGYASACHTLQTVEQGSFEQIDTCRKLEKQLAGVCRERDALVAAQADHDEQLYKVQSALEAREREVADLNEHLAAITERRSEAENEVYEHAEAHRLLEREVEELRARCEKTTGELTVGRVQHLELQHSIADYEGRISALKSGLEAAHQERLEFEHQTQYKFAAQAHVATELAELRSEYSELQQRLDAESERVKDEHQEVAKRNERIELLEVDLRSANSEYRQATEKLARLNQEHAASEEQLAALRRELAESKSCLAELAEGESRRANERDQLSAALEAAREEISRLQAAAEAIPQDIAATPEQLAAVEEEKAELARQIESQQDLLTRLTTELEKAQGRWEQSQSQLERLEGLYKQSQRELTAVQESLASAEKALDEATLASDAPKTTVAPVAGETEEAIEHLRELSVWSDRKTSDAQPLEEPAAAPAASKGNFQPASFIEQYGPMFEAEPDAPAAAPSPWTNPASPPQIAGASHAAAGGLFAPTLPDESDDAALEAYMNSLMRRVRGDSHTPASHGEPPRPVKPKQPEPEVPSYAAAAAEGQSAIAAQQPLDMDSLRMTSHKPPLATDLKALRELANTSARRAIAKHSKARHRERALSKLLVCAVASGVAAYMMLSAESIQSPLFLAGLVPAVIGLRWGAKFLGVVVEAIREGAWRKTNAVELSVDEEPLPIDGRAESNRLAR